MFRLLNFHFCLEMHATVKICESEFTRGAPCEVEITRQNFSMGVTNIEIGCQKWPLGERLAWQKMANMTKVVKISQQWRIWPKKSQRSQRAILAKLAYLAKMANHPPKHPPKGFLWKWRFWRIKRKFVCLIFATLVKICHFPRGSFGHLWMIRQTFNGSSLNLPFSLLCAFLVDCHEW